MKKLAIIGLLIVGLTQGPVLAVAWYEWAHAPAAKRDDPLHSLYVHYLITLQKIPVIGRRLRLGDTADGLLYWIGNMEARRRADQHARRGLYCLLCGNGITFVWGLPDCEITVARRPKDSPFWEIERRLGGGDGVPEWVVAEPGVLDQVTCELESGERVTFEVDAFGGGCIHHPYFVAYNRQMMKHLLRGE